MITYYIFYLKLLKNIIFINIIFKKNYIHNENIEYININVNMHNDNNIYNKCYINNSIKIFNIMKIKIFKKKIFIIFFIKKY